LRKRFGAVVALDGVDLQADQPIATHLLQAIAWIAGLMIVFVPPCHPPLSTDRLNALRRNPQST
jgi:hypothetical protein